jgi:hypothetical protein
LQKQSRILRKIVISGLSSALDSAFDCCACRQSKMDERRGNVAYN